MKSLRFDNLSPTIVRLCRLDELSFSLPKVLDQPHVLELVIGALEASDMRLLEMALCAAEGLILLVKVEVVQRSLRLDPFRLLLLGR